LIRDPGWVKKSESGSGMNNPDHISRSLETIFWVKILKFFWGIRDKHPGSATLVLTYKKKDLRISKATFKLFNSTA
jgi:hypothetical protein